MSEPQNAEDLVIEFENKSGSLKYVIRHRAFHGEWCITVSNGVTQSVVANFKLLEQAEKCAEALKESV